METKNYSKGKYWWARFIQGVSLVALAFAVLISCQKKSNSNTNYAIPPGTYAPGVIGQCAGCTFAQVQLGTATSQGSGFTIQWNVVGDQAVVQQMLYVGTSPVNYSGPVRLSGTMNVTTPIYFNAYGAGYGYANNGCVIPAGSYQFDTLQVGQASYGTIPQMAIQMYANGIQMQIALAAVFMDPSYSRQVTGIYGTMVSSTCGGSGISFSQ